MADGKSLISSYMSDEFSWPLGGGLYVDPFLVDQAYVKEIDGEKKYIVRVLWVSGNYVLEKDDFERVVMQKKWLRHRPGYVDIEVSRGIYDEISQKLSRVQTHGWSI